MATTYTLSAHDEISAAFDIAPKSSTQFVVNGTPNLGAQVLIQRFDGVSYLNVDSIGVGRQGFINEIGGASYRLQMFCPGYDGTISVDVEIS